MATTALTAKQKVDKMFDTMKGDFKWTNKHQAPKLEKIIVSVGTGKSRKDSRRLKVVEDRLQKITGQKASVKKAKLSIAQFKLREGEEVGYMVTLRGKQMYAFFDKLVHIALPRSRDFRGIKVTSVDAMGNISIGLKEHTIFPETSDEDLQDVFPLGITIVSTAKDKKTATAFFTALGMPFQK